ncbi:hypothetical protein LCGC14_0712590 [marine sediment metagenome]|uniref:Uncharacterized protein n=1 Tax=marine sediment metagenome TaxID=412755 RepID=A0A0F9TM57_9ZZZZ
MSLRRQVINTVFVGETDPLTNIIKRTKGTAVSPDGVVKAVEGTFLVMDYNGNDADDDVYINTDGSTAWTLIYDASVRGHLY